LLIVNSESPYRTLGDLVNAGKAPGAAGINFGASSGLMSGLLKAATGAKIVYVPYRGEANSTLAVLAKEVDVAFVTGAAAAPHIQAGKIRAVANLASARSALYPNVPTAMESGVPGVKVDLWFGFLGPAGMPPQVVQVLERKFRQIAMEPEIKSRFEQLQMTSAAIGPQEFSAQLDAEFSYLTPLVKAMVDRGELK
jgi:tripartite-type tricarboxylate transporter receptor subunit TctC